MSTIQERVKTEGHPFGQTESLTDRIKGLIREYPEGIGIIKEIIQNADDAGARKLHILIDWRRHPQEGLPERMKKLQGPALLAYNDAVFSRNDFTHIQKIGISGKARTAEKTGRFGLGFNAVYNLTDWPGFFTAGAGPGAGDDCLGEPRIAFFDPNLSAIEGATPEKPGGWWELERCRENFPGLLAPFEAALPDGVTRLEDCPGTIFRFPLRTARHAPDSRISNKPVEEGSLGVILAKLGEAGEELLLFLKCLEEFQVLVIPETSEAEPQLLLSVTTTNPEVVRPQREKVLAALRGRTEALVAHLAEKSAEAVSVSYRHEFRIEWKGGKTVAGWRVVSGLFEDSEGEVARTAQKMAWRDEKAVPWAGAAARISRLADGVDCPLPVVGRAYCSLPLPVETGLPVHLHGFFDLDSSRHALTTDGGQSGKDAIRVQWNQVLVRHAVSRAYAALIEKVAGDIGDKDPRAYYGLWPEGDRVLGKPFEELIKSTIKQVAPLNVVRSARAAAWLPIGKMFVLPAAWSALQDPLAREGAALPDPPLPPHVLAGFRTAGVGVHEYRPQQLRVMLLRTREVLGVGLDEAPRPSLRRREWVALMLRFCLSDQSKDLKGLPLAILADGKLKTIGLDRNDPIFLAGREERELFAGNPEWFLDETFAAECAVPDVAEAGLRTFTPADALLKLQEILSSTERALPWDPDGQDPPNASWLTRLYRYLAAERLKGFSPDRKVMAKIWMVPAEGNTLWQPIYVSTPLLPLEPVDGAFRAALIAFDLRVIEADGDLLKAIQAFVEAGPELFIWRLSGPNLVNILDSRPKQGLPEYEVEVHEPLLDYLAQPRWKTQYGKDRLDQLRRLCIYPTTEGGVVSLNERVFLPSCEPPEVAASVVLLQTGKNGCWRWLLDLFKVPLLTREALIRTALLPAYAGLGARQVDALRWIRDEFNAAETEIDEAGGDSGFFKRTVANADLVLCRDGRLHPICKTHDPHSPVIRGVLGEGALYPDMAGTYARGPEHWLDFFRALGMLNMPAADDLVAHVDRLTAQARGPVPESVAAQFRTVFTHVVAHWDDLKSQPVAGKPGSTLPQALKGRAWLPAERDPERLKSYPGNRIPEDRLYRAEEIYFPRQGHLVASQKPIFRVNKEPDQEIREALGFPAGVARDVAIVHFDRLIGLWEAAEHSGLGSI